MSDTGPILESLTAVSVHITDVAKARKFYGEILGLKEVAFNAERQRLVYEIPKSSTVLTMHVASDPREGGREPGTVSGIIFNHPDPAAALAEIQRRGGTVVAPAMKMPWGLVRGVFADLDGNEFVLSSPA
jgi:predicted enzyme related to lactoylglutathione lyase